MPTGSGRSPGALEKLLLGIRKVLAFEQGAVIYVLVQEIKRAVDVWLQLRLHFLHYGSR